MPKFTAKQRWMQAFEDAVVAADEKHRGKIEWQTAEFFHGQGKAAREAAAQYVETRKDAR